MDFTEGIKQIHVILAERERKAQEAQTTRYEFSHFLKRLEKARREYHKDLSLFMENEDYFDFPAWEKKNFSRDMWLAMAAEMSRISVVNKS